MITIAGGGFTTTYRDDVPEDYAVYCHARTDYPPGVGGNFETSDRISGPFINEDGGTYYLYMGSVYHVFRGDI